MYSASSAGSRLGIEDIAVHPGHATVHDQVEQLPGSFPCCYVAGVFDEEISDSDESDLVLRAPDGTEVMSTPIDPDQ